MSIDFSEQVQEYLIESTHTTNAQPPISYDASSPSRSFDDRFPSPDELFFDDRSQFQEVHHSCLKHNDESTFENEEAKEEHAVVQKGHEVQKEKQVKLTAIKHQLRRPKHL